MRKNAPTGRPSFKPTAAQRKTVAIAAGAGMSHEQIALGLGIARNTLTKHFEHELCAGAYQKRLEVVQALHAAAKRGNVAAGKAYMQFDPKIAAPTPEQPAAEPKAPAVGKKAQAQIDAGTAAVGTDWDNLLNQSPAAPLQ